MPVICREIDSKMSLVIVTSMAGSDGHNAQCDDATRDMERVQERQHDDHARDSLAVSSTTHG